MKLNFARPISVRAQLGAQRAGRYDPRFVDTADGVWCATRLGSGPAAVHFRQTDMCAVSIRARGPGADEAMTLAAPWIGADDQERPLDAVFPKLRSWAPRCRHLRLVKVPVAVDALVVIALHQKVTWRDAARSYARLCARLSEDAPGGVPGLKLPPHPRSLAHLDDDTFRHAGVLRDHARTVRTLAGRAAALQRLHSCPAAEVHKKLALLSGVGPWTITSYLSRARGEPDEPVVGDYHLPSFVAYNLAGEVRADDARMLELLAPYRGQRARFVQWLGVVGKTPPRFGPRRAPLYRGAARR